MKKIGLIILSLILLTGCYSDDRYEEGYRDGYRNGKDDALSDISNIEFDDAQACIERDGWYLVVEYSDYASDAGHSDGFFAKCPMESSSWLDHRDNDAFVDLYLDSYFEGYNWFSDIDYDGEFDYSVIDMIDTSRLSEAVIEVGYDEWHKVALIRWAQGTLYAYEDVERRVFEGLITSESMGTYVNEYIKDNYSYYIIEE